MSKNDKLRTDVITLIDEFEQKIRTEERKRIHDFIDNNIGADGLNVDFYELEDFIFCKPNGTSFQESCGTTTIVTSEVKVITKEETIVPLHARLKVIENVFKLLHREIFSPYRGMSTHTQLLQRESSKNLRGFVESFVSKHLTSEHDINTFPDSVGVRHYEDYLIHLFSIKGNKSISLQILIIERLVQKIKKALRELHQLEVNGIEVHDTKKIREWVTSFVETHLEDAIIPEVFMNLVDEETYLEGVTKEK